MRGGVGREQFFDWKARAKFAPVYMDLLKLGGNPPAMQVIADALVDAMRTRFPEADLIVGLAEAGLLYSPVVAHALSMPHSFVRKTAKAHGLPGRVAGSPHANARAVLIDDLTASGKSIREAIEVLREETAVLPVGVLSVVNWNFAAMWDTLAPAGVEVACLVSHPELLASAVELRLLTPRAAAELSAFYRDPWTHQWDFDALAGTRASA